MQIFKVAFFESFAEIPCFSLICLRSIRYFNTLLANIKLALFVLIFEFNYKNANLEEAAFLCVYSILHVRGSALRHLPFINAALCYLKYLFLTRYQLVVQMLCLNVANHQIYFKYTNYFLIMPLLESIFFLTKN